ncbi:hypothetical protein SAMN05444172_5430 [Burkholderia sp. GAS332]|nr:hypothetical protein SAMN05444172_5430 [Burkholderia sp. GAS332]
MKHLIKVGLLCVAFSFCELCSAQLPIQPSSCADAYQNALSNISIDDKIQVENSLAYQKYCSATGEFDKQDFGLQASVIVESIPFTVGLDNATDEQKIEQFCKTGFAQNGFYSSEQLYARTSADQAQKNFNQCRLLETNGLVVTHTYTAPRFVVIFGRYLDKNTVASIDRVSFIAAQVSCSSTSFGNGNPLAFSPRTPRMNATNDFTIQCERIPIHYTGKDFYPATQIVVSISKAGAEGPYSISVPEDNALGPALSSDASSQIADLNRQIKNANDAKADAISQRDAAISQRDIYSQRLDNAAVASVLTFSEGDSNVSWPGPRIDPRDHIGLQDWLSAQCGANRVAKYFQMSSWSGGCCGFSTYIGTCLSKQ